MSACRIEDYHRERYTRAPHRTGFFALILLEGGTGTYSLDGATYDAAPGTIYLARPGHVKSYTYHTPPSGWVVAFTEVFLKMHTDLGRTLPFLFTEALLAGSRASVKEIAYRLGFSEPTAFSRFFKRETGHSPTGYRQRVANERSKTGERS